jgi:hypothetical protein
MRSIIARKDEIAQVVGGLGQMQQQVVDIMADTRTTVIRV